jgi:hypothetical protein
VEAQGQVGSIAIPGLTVALNGVTAQGQVGTPNYFYWTTIDDSQTSNWQNVNNSQASGWVDVNDSQAPDWVDVEMVV